MKIKNKKLKINSPIIPFNKGDENKKAFTLVELIVVITILAILSTIGFVSYSGYLAGSRDSNRISQLKAISEGLQLYSTNHSLPTPDTTSTKVMDGSTQIATQGYAGKNVLETITYSTEGVDPKDKTYYSYYLTKNKKYYQLMGWLEEEDNLQNQATGIDYSIRYPIVLGNKLGILTDKDNTPIQETGITSIDISNLGIEIKSYLKDSEYVTGTGSRFSNLDEVDEKGGQYWSVKNNLFVYSNPNIDWRNQDSNCDLPDVIIGKQTWAGCNSTLGSGVEYGKKDNGTDGTIHASYGCYKNHEGTNNISDCVIGSTEMASNTKSNIWFTGTNLNGDSAPANIWGKLYTWTSLDTDSDNDIDKNDTNLVCGNGYHLPTDIEWEYAEEFLYDGTEDLSGCRTGNAGECTGQSWKNHTGNNDNLVEKLQIPLSGGPGTDYTFYERGYSTNLWSSSSDGNNAVRRFFYWDDLVVYRYNDSQDYAHSVRCIKD